MDPLARWDQRFAGGVVDKVGELHMGFGLRLALAWKEDILRYLKGYERATDVEL